MIEKPIATAVSATAIPTPTPRTSERRITHTVTPVSPRLLLAPAVALLLVACAGNDDPTRADQARQLAEDAGLPEEVQDWLALAAGSPDSDYRVAYGDLVVTQQDGERRVDAGEGGQAALAADPGPFDEAAVKRLVERLRASRDDFTFEIEDRRLLNVTARCLVTEPKDGEGATGVLCVSDEGALLLLEGGTGALEATSYDPL